jgi:hypothetical protein
MRPRYRHAANSERLHGPSIRMIVLTPHPRRTIRDENRASDVFRALTGPRRTVIGLHDPQTVEGCSIERQTERRVEDDAPDLHRQPAITAIWRQFRVNARICEQPPAERMGRPAQRILIGHETSSSASAVVPWLGSRDSSSSEPTFPACKGGEHANAPRGASGNRASRLW